MTTTGPLVQQRQRQGRYGDTSVLESCPIDCQNDGTCMKLPTAGAGGRPLGGEEPPPVFAFDATTAAANGGADNMKYHASSNETNYYCRCPLGSKATGVDCGTSYEVCPSTANGRVVGCYNGGRCNLTDEAVNYPFDDDGVHDGTGNLDYRPCDCGSAAPNGDDGAAAAYTGRYCEIPVEPGHYCDGGGGEGEGGRGSGEAFCLNGGTCRRDSSGEEDGATCDCPDGYAGEHCEYPIRTSSLEGDTKEGNGDDGGDSSPSCDLVCHNGGNCTNGDYVDSSNEWRLKLFGGTTSPRRGMYCKCPEGYDGLQCEYQMRVCGRDGGDGHGEHVCLHGTICVRDNTNKNEDGSGSWRCECPPAGGGGSSSSCPLDTDYCSPTSSISDDLLQYLDYVEGMAAPAFCLNGGKCKDDVVVDGKLYPGCECPHLFYGQNCEFLRTGNQIKIINATATEKSSGHHDGSIRQPGLVSLGILVAMVFLAGVWLYGMKWWKRRQAHRRQAKHEEMMNMNLHSFRDENSGAMSANGNLLFPSMGNGINTAFSPNGNMLFPAMGGGGTTPSFNTGQLYDVEVI